MHSFEGIEIIVFTVMSYDIYVAICKPPPNYTIIMSRGKCHVMVATSCAGAFYTFFLQSFLVISLPLCGPNEMDLYFCDVLSFDNLATSIHTEVDF
ncbi:hypothetical protein U0070_006763 [Myodes glareolus]|uniref:Olfactory receptor n=1 Tax=Myodes glareolus TaxID=447135 RepID=A0AAW0HZL2_MYOGA